MEKVETMKTLGALIRKARKDQGATQEQLSAVSGVGIRFIRELEQGKASCHMGKVLQVIKTLGDTLYFVKRGEMNR